MNTLRKKVQRFQYHIDLEIINNKTPLLENKLI